MMLLAIICLLQVAIQVSLPYYYGSQLYWKKIALFKTGTDYNAVCFGSSRLFRQVDPERLNDSMSDIRLFNFGVPGAFNPESYFLYENFIDDIDSGQVKLAVLELQDLDTLTENNVKTVRSSYWNRDLGYALDYINDDSFDSLKQRKALRQYITGYLHGLINFSKISAFRHFRGMQMPKGKDGFHSLDSRMANSKSQGLVKKTLVLQDSIAVKEHITVAAFPKGSSEVLKANKIHREMLNHLIDKSEKKGIELYFVIPPKLTEYQAVRAIEKLMPDRVINLGSSYEYPEFYRVENSFDIEHLNDRGTRMFTDALASRLIELRAKRKGTN